MYENMTLEQMIQRLYDGNFTTAELERQLIAEIFRKLIEEYHSDDGSHPEK